MNRRGQSLLTACAIALSATGPAVPVASAALIDSFTDVPALSGGFSTSVVTTSPTAPVAVESTSSVYGGTRTTWIELNASEFPGLDRVSVVANSSAGAVSFTSSAGANGFMMLGYSNGTPVIDLTSELIEIDLLAYDAPAGDAPLMVGVGPELGNSGYSVTFVSTTQSGPQTLRIDLSSHDIDSADSFRIFIDTPKGGDVVIGEIRTAPIPEPAGVALLCAAGLLLTRRRV